MKKTIKKIVKYSEMDIDGINITVERVPYGKTSYKYRPVGVPSIMGLFCLARDIDSAREKLTPKIRQARIEAAKKIEDIDFTFAKTEEGNFHLDVSTKLSPDFFRCRVAGISVPLDIESAGSLSLRVPVQFPITAEVMSGGQWIMFLRLWSI